MGGVLSHKAYENHYAITVNWYTEKGILRSI